MPDLRTPAVTDWLHLFQSRDMPTGWPPPIRPVENSSHAEALLGELGQRLDEEAMRSPDVLYARMSTDDAIVRLQLTVAQLGAARTMRIMHWLREGGLPGGVAIGNAIMGGHTQAARAIRASVTTVARQATLARLMSASRLNELASAAETAAKENVP
jgi:hypothetical protein